MTEQQETYQTLDLALRIGEVLLSSGAGAADVSATMQAVASAGGLRGADVDVTFTALSMSHQKSFDEPPLMLVRNVKHRDIDYEDLTLVDHLVHQLLNGEITREQARTQVARVVSTGHRLPRWAVMLGKGVTGGGIGLLLGGADLVVIGVAFGSAVAIDVIQRFLSRRRLPEFYQQVAGAMLATLIAVGVSTLEPRVELSVVVTAGIIMLLSGIGFMGAIQDALTGFPITANARVLEAVLSTAGIIAGVSGGFALAESVGVGLGQLEPGGILGGWNDLGFQALGAAIAAGAFAFAAYAPMRTLLPIAVVAAAAQLIAGAVGDRSVDRTWAVAAAAIVIGVVSYSVAGRFRVPPLVVVVPAIVPLLPGLAIYRGLSLMSVGDNSGIIALAGAASTAIALASGVILGEYLAQPLKREARRLESRLAGPRLVGPMRPKATLRSRRRDQRRDRRRDRRRAERA